MSIPVLDESWCVCNKCSDPFEDDPREGGMTHDELMEVIKKLAVEITVDEIFAPNPLLTALKKRV